MAPSQVFTLNGSGSEIPAFNVISNYTNYIITGTAIATGNYSLSSVGTPILGACFSIFFEGNLNITSNSTTFTIFGTALNQTQLQTKWQAYVFYDGTQWIVNIYSNFAQAILTQQNFTSNSIPVGALMSSSVVTSNITSGAITNPLLATNSVGTLNVIAQAITNSKLAPGPNASIKCTNPSGLVEDVSLSVGQVPVNIGGIIQGVDLSSAVGGIYETINTFASFDSGKQGGIAVYIPYSCKIINILAQTVETLSGTDNATLTFIDSCASTTIGTLTIPMGSVQNNFNSLTNINYVYIPICGTVSTIGIAPQKTTVGGYVSISIVVQRI